MGYCSVRNWLTFEAAQISREGAGSGHCVWVPPYPSLPAPTHSGRRTAETVLLRRSPRSTGGQCCMPCPTVRLCAL